MTETNSLLIKMVEMLRDEVLRDFFSRNPALRSKSDEYVLGYLHAVCDIDVNIFQGLIKCLKKE